MSFISISCNSPTFLDFNETPNPQNLFYTGTYTKSLFSSKKSGLNNYSIEVWNFPGDRYCIKQPLPEYSRFSVSPAIPSRRY